MHSNILAALNNKPFVAVSYEHKTEGIAKQLGLEEYCIKCDNLDQSCLSSLLVNAYRDRNVIQRRIKQSVKRIQDKEYRRWSSILLGSYSQSAYWDTARSTKMMMREVS